MIDAHLHVVPPRLPGVGPLSPRLEAPPAAVAAWLNQELISAGIEQCLAMGHWSHDERDPLGIADTLAVAEHLPGLHAIGVCDPGRNDPEHRKRVEEELATGRVKALKVFLGYLHFEPTHNNYRTYYEMAERFQLPVVFHCGDTYSPFAKLKYAHPLTIDDAAVDHPKVRFVIAHLGNPWMIDAAAVIYKNINVWADLSGLVVGDEFARPSEETAATLADVSANVQRAMRYAERPNRFVFGSDWPLVGLANYRELIASWVPDAWHELVFRDNARALFRLPV